WLGWGGFKIFKIGGIQVHATEGAGSGFMNRTGGAIGRATGGLHSPTLIVTIRTREIDASDGLDHGRPESAQLARLIRSSLASHCPRVARPIDRQVALNVGGFTG